MQGIDRSSYRCIIWEHAEAVEMFMKAQRIDRNLILKHLVTVDVYIRTSKIDRNIMRKYSVAISALYQNMWKLLVHYVRTMGVTFLNNRQ